MNARTLRRCNLALLACWIAAAAAVYPRLPARIPLHFSFTGTADAWTRTSLGVWLLLPGVGAAVVLFGYLLSSAAARTPEMWKLRSDDLRRLRALPLCVRDELAESGQRATAWALLLATLALMGVQLGVYATALGGAARMPWYASALTWGSVAAALLLGLRDRARLRRRIRGASSPRSP